MKKISVLTLIMLFTFTVLSVYANENAKPQELYSPSEGENQEVAVGQVLQKYGEFVLENDAFRIYEPDVDVPQGRLVVRGLARVFEATVQYEFEDGHYLFDQGFVTATEGAPGWGEFEIVIDIAELPSGRYMVILYEESAEDGSRLHDAFLPIIIER